MRYLLAAVENVLKQLEGLADYASSEPENIGGIAPFCLQHLAWKEDIGPSRFGKRSKYSKFSLYIIVKAGPQIDWK